jgi:hypothetical protein
LQIENLVFREGLQWIKLILNADLLSEMRMNDILDEAVQLCNIVGKSVVRTKANLKSEKSTIKPQEKAKPK